MASSNRAFVNKHACWVVKVGSSLLTDAHGLNHERLDVICDQLTELKRREIHVVIVSSGAIADGSLRLGLDVRPHELPLLQAAASVGQMGLMHAYETRFRKSGFLTGLVLLTHDDLRNRERYLNARSTLETSIKHRVIPVINENDSVSTDEIRFGDNDTLAARVATLLQADALVLMTDQEGLCTSDPRENPNATLVPKRSAFDRELDGMVNGPPGQYGRGGMLSKLEAARFAAKAGCSTFIVDGRQADALLRLYEGEAIGTNLYADVAPMEARKRWIAGQIHSYGEIQVDDGAAEALRSNGVSLLPIGIQRVSGAFNRGDLVTIVDANGNQIARGLSNYNAKEARRIMGHASTEIEELLGYMDQPSVIHRDNLALS